jgi:7-cyano-7-deazaguanine synthase in queuosine biosynthesis
MKIDAFLNPADRAQDGLCDIIIRMEDGRECHLDLPFRDLYRRCGLPSSLALDLLITAGICYAVDKSVSRILAPDGWTRDLEIKIPVSDPNPWLPVNEALSETLTFLTGDVWRLSFYQANGSLFQKPKKEAIPTVYSAEAVSLFSGGLDSLAGAIDLLTGSDSSKIFIIGHYDAGGPRKTQSDLAAGLNQSYKDRLRIEHVRVAQRPAKAVEETLRSRSFVFIALGLYAAQAGGPEVPLYTFENGLIALNIPLTPSRRGSCSTRTMHPYYLQNLRAIVEKLGIPNKIINPYALMTKGECVTQCKNAGLLAKLAGISVSCSHSSRRQDWVRKNAKNCGYCVPCIFRRAALNKAGLDDGQQYGIDVLTGELKIEDPLESANDFRAIVDFLQGPLSPAALRRHLIATAEIPDLDAYAQMAFRGFSELKSWVTKAKILAAAIKHA